MDELEQTGAEDVGHSDVAPAAAPKAKRTLTPEQREAKRTKDRDRRATKKAAAPQQTESEMSTTKKARKAKKEPKTAKPKAEKKAKAPKAAKAKATNGHAGPRGEKTLEIARLLQRKNGVTRAEILEYTGWPSVSVQAMAKAAGLKLSKSKEKGSPTSYFGEAKA